MTSIPAKFKTMAHFLPRTAALLLLLTGPVIALPSLQSDGGGVIEAPVMKKNGAGFVLLVSLRRG